MRTLFLILTLITFASSNQYTFLVNKYDKEIELEAKIVSKIAQTSMNSKIKIFIPAMTNSEKDIYSKFFDISNNCQEANFIFVKKQVNINQLCQEKNKLFFTNNYQTLLTDDRYFGAFFWNKSRPNIVFIKERLKAKKIELSSEYEQFIEDF